MARASPSPQTRDQKPEIRFTLVFSTAHPLSPARSTDAAGEEEEHREVLVPLYHAPPTSGNGCRGLSAPAQGISAQLPSASLSGILLAVERPAPSFPARKGSVSRVCHLPGIFPG